MNSNFMQVVMPDFKLHIGIKNGEVCSVDWGEMLIFKQYPDLTEKQRNKELISYYKKAIKYLKQKSK
jgi:hypothetical protein